MAQWRHWEFSEKGKWERRQGRNFLKIAPPAFSCPTAIAGEGSFPINLNNGFRQHLLWVYWRPQSWPTQLPDVPKMFCISYGESRRQKTNQKNCYTVFLLPLVVVCAGASRVCCFKWKEFCTYISAKTMSLSPMEAWDKNLMYLVNPVRIYIKCQVYSLQNEFIYPFIDNELCNNEAGNFWEDQLFLFLIGLLNWLNNNECYWTFMLHSHPSKAKLVEPRTVEVLAEILRSLF